MWWSNAFILPWQYSSWLWHSRVHIVWTWCRFMNIWHYSNSILWHEWRTITLEKTHLVCTSFTSGILHLNVCRLVANFRLEVAKTPIRINLNDLYFAVMFGKTREVKQYEQRNASKCNARNNLYLNSNFIIRDNWVN